MTTRATSRKVTFVRPFFLTGLDAVQPAGIYCVVTEEEVLDTVLIPSYRRISTQIELHAPGHGTKVEMLTIEPAELEAALERDSAGAHDADVTVEPSNRASRR